MAATALVVEKTGQGLVVEGARASPVRMAGPEIDHEFSVADQGKAGAQLAPLSEIGGEGLAHGLQAAGAMAVDGDGFGGRGQASRSIRTWGEVAFSRWAMATTGSSAVFHIWAAAMVSATPPTARASA